VNREAPFSRPTNYYFADYTNQSIGLYSSYPDYRNASKLGTCIGSKHGYWFARMAVADTSNRVDGS